jgi:hypothetical protein
MKLQDLTLQTQETVRLAGPRYSPGLHPGAPNLEMRHLVEAVDALSLDEGFRTRLRELASAMDKACLRTRHVWAPIFHRRTTTPDLLVEEAERLAGSQTTEDIHVNATRFLRSANRVSRKLTESFDETLGLLLAEGDARPTPEMRSQLETRRQHLSSLLDPVDELREYLNGPNGDLLSRRTAMVLLGAWGTGKTHFLCDIARRKLAKGKPALVVLASSLPKETDALDGVARATRLAKTSVELLDGLEELGRRTHSRALLIIDAINEGDRMAWRQELPKLARRIRGYPHVALIVSCRRPFDRLILTSSASKLYVPLEHPGFEEQEFNAQLEFFGFYGIPAPPVPLITPEFSRPLFLKLLCEAIRGLGKRPQKRRLREIASGQKGMTYVFEHFVKAVGETIESDFGLPPRSCWPLLKGTTRAERRGIAGSMADRGREWLLHDEAIGVLQSDLSMGVTDARALLHRLALAGLLAEEVRWIDNQVEEVVQFGYQRFGDHVIARHLLEEHLNTTSEAAVRRCFYAGRKIGDVFLLDHWGRAFQSPGIAGAIMLELPERLKRTNFPREVVSYLPRSRRLVEPIKDIFLDGLYWRSVDSFDKETDGIVAFFLENEESRTEALEVLVGLASRPHHPYSAARLREYVVELSMPNRDASWSEFLRVSHEYAAIYRLLAWVESWVDEQADTDAVANYIRLISLSLTTTKRPLRDRATRSLFLLGLRKPKLLFEEVLASFDFDDPYIPERMLAAAYGVVMNHWASPKGADLREAIVPFARGLVRAMFLPEAPHATWHVLMRDYAQGIIELARKVDPTAIATQHVHHLRSADMPPSPFRSSTKISDSDVAAARHAMHMDFENYTLGRLVPDRANYEDSHVEYQLVRRQIAQRMVDLGYSQRLFEELDRRIVRSQGYSRTEDGGKTDRYGKKYSWISFFEMYGLRASERKLEDRRLAERTSDCDIDPSFPRPARSWTPALPDLFRHSARGAERWLRDGPTPNYVRLLTRKTVGRAAGGPWVLLDGYINQSGSYRREVVTFLKGLLVDRNCVAALEASVHGSRGMVDFHIPEGASDYYTFAGEIPWSQRFGTDVRRRDGTAQRLLERVALRDPDGRLTSCPVEVPTQRWAWESYHSSLNQVDASTLPAPAISEAFGLVGRQASWDLFDGRGRLATLYREFSAGSRYFPSHLLYIRADLIRRYLRDTKQTLVWMPWGERILHWTDPFPSRTPAIDSALRDGANLFGSFISWVE